MSDGPPTYATYGGEGSDQIFDAHVGDGTSMTWANVSKAADHPGLVAKGEDGLRPEYEAAGDSRSPRDTRAVRSFGDRDDRK
jgi:hypothetical protein